jgi:hypothetical protein
LLYDVLEQRLIDADQISILYSASTIVISDEERIGKPFPVAVVAYRSRESRENHLVTVSNEEDEGEEI